MLIDIPVEQLIAETLDGLPTPGVDVIAPPPSGRDDYAALAEAIAAAKGEVLLRPGDYYLSRPLQLKDGLCLRGVGPGERTGAAQGNRSVGSRLLPADDFYGTAIVRVAMPDGRRPLAGCTVRDLSIDGRLLGDSLTGLFFSSYRGAISNVNIANCTGDGLVVEGVAADPNLTPPRPQWQSYDSRYEGVRSHHNGRHGILFGPHSPDSQCDGLMVFRNGGDGIRFQSSSHQIGTIHAYNNGENGLHFDGAGSRSEVGKVKAEQNGRSGVFVNGATGGVMFLSFGMVELKNNCTAATTQAPYDQLHITGNPGAVIGTWFGRLAIADITGEGGLTKLARYGVNLANGYVRDTHIGSLHIEASGYKTAAINDLGQRTLVSQKRAS